MVAKYRVRHRRLPSQTWRTFLENHIKQLVSVDFFTVPTVSFRVLYVFIVLAHGSRRVLHFNVTEHPTAEWTAEQLSGPDLAMVFLEVLNRGHGQFNYGLAGAENVWIRVHDEDPIGSGHQFTPGGGCPQP